MRASEELLGDASLRLYLLSVTGDQDTPTVMGAADLHLAARRLEMLRRVTADGHVVEAGGSHSRWQSGYRAARRR
jgi:hypothetical protein